MSGYIVEYQVGKVSLVSSNLLVKDIMDMEILEFWEDRLKRLNQPFAVLFKRTKRGVKYCIYTNMKRKGSIFR